MFFLNTAITIGFTQPVYTFNEGIDFFSEIPIIKGNNQKSEITFTVRISLSFGNSANNAALNVDFIAAEVQRKDCEPDEQSILFVFEVIDDVEMETAESFDVELSLAEENLLVSMLEALSLMVLLSLVEQELLL